MATIRQQARLAGLLYFLMLVVGTPGLLLFPSVVIVHNDPAETAEHIRNSETILRLGIASQLAGQVGFLFAAVALYRLFGQVSRTLALQMLALILVSIPIGFFLAVNELAAIVLVGPAPFLAAIPGPYRESLAYFFLRLYYEGIGVVWVFWALWLVPYGLLVIRSGFIPKIFGALLLVAAAGDLIRAATLLFPAAPDALGRAAGILGLAELPIVLWLLIWGARETPAPKPAAA